MKEIKVAFIGAGNMASKHIEAFCDIEEVSLVGIFSRTKYKSHKLAQS